MNTSKLNEVLVNDEIRALEKQKREIVALYQATDDLKIKNDLTKEFDKILNEIMDIKIRLLEEL